MIMFRMEEIGKFEGTKHAFVIYCFCGEIYIYLSTLKSLSIWDDKVLTFHV